MSRRIIALVIVATTLLIMNSFLAHAASPTRIGVPSPSVSYFPAIVAWKKGFFAQEGIQAEFIVMKPSIIPAALTNGEIHFSTATGTVVGAILRGFPFKVVTYYSTRLMDSLVVKPQIKTVASVGPTRPTARRTAASAGPEPTSSGVMAGPPGRGR